MADIFAWWKQDAVILPTGDLLQANGTIEGEQRIMRRLLTTAGTYIWHLEYGAGLPNYVGQPAMADAIASLTIAQLMVEDAVAKTPLPVVKVQSNALGYLSEDIKYVDNDTGLPASLNFNLE